MSLPSNVQSALDALNTVGARVKAAKESGDDVTSILEEYKTLQAALSDVVRPLADSNKGSEFFWNVIAPVLERVMDKPERKKHDKEKKKWKKAVAAGGAPAAPGAPAAAPAAPAPAAADGEKKVSKSELKRIEKAKKKAAAKAKNAAAKMAEAAKMAAGGGGAATTTTTTTRRDGAGNGAERTKKSRRVASTSTTTAAVLTPPMSSPPRTPVAGTVDPTRASKASVVQILTAAKLFGVPVQLGRFQTSTLFQDVPCYDVGDGTILAGSFAGELLLLFFLLFSSLLLLFESSCSRVLVLFLSQGRC